MKTRTVLFATASLWLAGCASFAGSTNVLTDDRIRSESAGALGYAPGELAIDSRRTEGTNTFVSLTAKDGKQFNCIINGGNWMSLGVTNPPMCSRKGEPMQSPPFAH